MITEIMITEIVNAENLNEFTDESLILVGTNLIQIQIKSQGNESYFNLTHDEANKLIIGLQEHLKASQ